MLVPPIESWPPGSFEHPYEERSLAIIILIAAVVPLMILTVAARIYSRIYLVKGFGWDDIFILAASIPGLAYAVIGINANINMGWRFHEWDLKTRPDLMRLGMALTMVNYILFAWSSSMTKISMLLFTRRILGVTMQRIRSTIDLTILGIFVELTLFSIIIVFTCRPISDFWTISEKPQNCMSETHHLMISGALNSMTDFLVVLLPIPLALNLNIPRRQKRILVLMFGAGFVVSIAGVVRLYYTYLFTITYDRPWAGYPVWVLGFLEIYLGLITASLPGLKPLFFRRGTCIDPLPTGKDSAPAIRWVTALSHDSAFYPSGRNTDCAEHLSRSSMAQLPDSINSREEGFFASRHPDLIPKTYGHGSSSPSNESLAKEQIPQRPGIVKRQSGSTERKSDQNTDPHSAIIVGTVIETFSTPRSEGRNSPGERDGRLSPEIQNSGPEKEERYTVSISAQTSIHSSRTSSRTSMSSSVGGGESRTNRPTSMRMTSSRPGEEGNALRSTMESLGFGKRS